MTFEREPAFPCYVARLGGVNLRWRVGRMLKYMHFLQVQPGFSNGRDGVVEERIALLEHSQIFGR